ncbi:MAG: TolC family protein [Chitinophagaceae bacterium]
MTRYCFIIVNIILTVFNSNGFSQEVPTRLSLQQAVDIAVKNNIQVKQSSLRMETAEINRKQANADMLPNLNGNFNYGWNNGRNIDPFTNTYVNQEIQGSNVGVSGQWNFFNGLQIHNNKKQQSLNEEASKMDLQQIKENTTIMVIMNYLQVLNNEDLLKNIINQAEVTGKQVERLEIMVKEGAVGGYLLSDMKGQLSNDQVGIVNAANSLDLAKLNLCQLLNIPYKKELQLERNDVPMPAEIYPGNEEEIIKTALNTLPVIKASDLRIKSAGKGIKVQQASFFPQVGLYGNLFSSFSSAFTLNIPTTIVNQPTNDFVEVNNTKFPVISPVQNYKYENIRYGTQMKNNVGSSFGIGAQIPLFNNFRTRFRVEQAKVNLKTAEVERENTELQLRQNIEQAYANMTASFNRYKAYADQYTNFRESFRAYEIRFNAGTINSVEYLTAKNNFDRATISFTQVRYEYIFRTKILDYYQGKLVL